MIRYLRQWRRDWYYVFTNELRMIFCDSGVMVIFFLAGLKADGLSEKWTQPER